MVEVDRIEQRSWDEPVGIEQHQPYLFERGVAIVIGLAGVAGAYAQ